MTEKLETLIGDVRSDPYDWSRLRVLSRAVGAVVASGEHPAIRDLFAELETAAEDFSSSPAALWEEPEAEPPPTETYNDLETANEAGRTPPASHVLLALTHVVSAVDSAMEGARNRAAIAEEDTPLRQMILLELHEPQRPSDLVASVLADKSQVSRALRSLMAEGLVQRVESAPGSDGRERRYHLSEEGRAAVASLQGVRKPAPARAGGFWVRAGAVSDALRSIRMSVRPAAVVCPPPNAFMVIDVAFPAASTRSIVSIVEQLERVVEREAKVEVLRFGDGLLGMFEDSSEALNCAVDIQRTVADRRQHGGFFPEFRIGLYGGEFEGLHNVDVLPLARRIIERAQGGEIVATWDTSAGPVNFESEKTTVHLRGMRPMDVFKVRWDDPSSARGSKPNAS